MLDHVSIKIVGPAGFGIKTTGLALAKFFMRQGFYVSAYTEYPSLIRGGHNTYQIEVSKKEVRGTRSTADVLFALSAESLEKEVANLAPGSTVILDSDIKISGLAGINTLRKNKTKFISAPLVKSAKFIGSEVMKNSVGFGILAGLFEQPFDKIKKILADFFKGEENIKQNQLAAKAGWEWFEEHKKEFDTIKLPKKNACSDKMLITGNQACALGAVAANCQLYAAYPMTPATEILHVLEAKQRETGMMVHQTEDEIAAIHAALGASFTGARAACGTSGGGFALMNEGLSLAGMLELPLVLFEVMRPAPATGNPTWTDQGDLSYVLHASHGEFPKVVLAPGSPEEAFVLTQHAFDLADRFQLPVIVLSDKYLGETSFTEEEETLDEVLKINRGEIILSENKIPKNYKRYLLTTDGISPRAIPGLAGGEHVANSDEHDEFSFSDEGSKNRIDQMDKRLKKLEGVRENIPLPKVYGPQKADITLVAWGSTLGVLRDALEEFNSQSKKKANLVHFSYIWPLAKNIDKFLSKFKKLILVENNATGQLGKLIAQETGIQIKDKILKYDSRPFWTDELVDKINKMF